MVFVAVFLEYVRVCGVTPAPQQSCGCRQDSVPAWGRQAQPSSTLLNPVREAYKQWEDKIIYDPASVSSYTVDHFSRK